jgi:tetratricopeptide (TPR) repeat protein
VTVTQRAAGSTPTTSAATTVAPATGDPHTLTDQATALMQRGDYAQALPLLQQAVQDLQGQTGDVYDAYANYNLGVTLIQLGRCGDALPYLETAHELEPSRHEVQDALKQARKC